MDSNKVKILIAGAALLLALAISLWTLGVFDSGSGEGAELESALDVRDAPEDVREDNPNIRTGPDGRAGYVPQGAGG